GLLQGDESARREGLATYDQALKLYQRASELPPTDVDTRIIIARARARMGYIRVALSSAKGAGNGFEPRLLAEALADYRRSTERLERPLEEPPGDGRLRRYLADAVGLFGLGCCSRFARQEQEAERFYRRAIELRRELVRSANPGAVGAQPRTDIAGETD